MVSYEKHVREYTMVGISACWEALLSKDFTDYVGTTFKEVLTVVDKGQYFHFQRVGDRERTAKTFLRERYEKNKVDLKEDTNTFIRQINEYSKLVTTTEREFNTKVIFDFYKYYRSLVTIAYLAIDPPDYVGVLKSKTDQKKFLSWAMKVRKLAETIYKHGETKFVPTMLRWVVKNKLKGYTTAQIQSLYFEELISFLKNKSGIPSPAELTQRTRVTYLSQLPDGKYDLRIGKDAEELILKNKLFETDINLSELNHVKGQVAFSGKVRGRARIITRNADLKKFRKGEVLITPMTDPSYLPIMKHAAGFVTDEGGVLSHASIVAREMKKPCVIGTKYSTEIFKDGDLVEVDADKGVVRKL